MLPARSAFRVLSTRLTRNTRSMSSSIPEGHANSFLTTDGLFWVKDMKAVVTGGGSGIGLMITQALVSNGAKVYITGRTEEKLTTVKEHYSAGGSIEVVQGDITSKESIKEIYEKIKAAEPEGIHLLVNNAGIAGEGSREGFSDVDKEDPEAMSKKLLETSWDEFNSILHTNVTGQYFMGATFLPLLCKAANSKVTGATQYRPSIINISSISGLLKSSTGGQYAYGASKAALIQITRAWANELSTYKIRVNTIAPGIFPSEMTGDSSDEKQKTHLGKDAGASLPAGRPGMESDMAAAVLYLASRGGNFVTGQILHPDGGAVATRPSSL